MSAIAFAEDSNVPFKYFGPGYSTDEEIWNLIESADMVADYTFRGRININVGKLEGNVHHPITFNLEELEYYFDKQKHKDLIVIWFDKRAQVDGEKIQKLVEQLNKYFFQRGYKRIVLLQGLGDGVGLYSDILNPHKDL